MAEVANLDAAGFADRLDLSFQDIGYDPSVALGLSTIQSSAFALDQAELDRLKADGFVISDRSEFPNFTYGYGSLYSQDVPLFVSADSILYALHRSYDNTLKALEEQSLIPALREVLAAMQGRVDELPSGDLRTDVETYLSVARNLLDGTNQGPGADLVGACVAAEGVKRTTLFGVQRDVDFSQCKPRGHYTDSVQLERYFRAMMWLGRIDFRLIETQEDGSQVFRRRQFDAMVGLRQLLGAEFAVHRDIDRVITEFVGEHDYMTVPQVDALLADLGVSDLAGTSGLEDEAIAKAVARGGYGTQRISSHYMVNGTGVGTLPLSSSFALFGQRYVIDSHVFSNVVYDRVGKGEVLRMMPNPLDAAYAVFDNDQAGALLSGELEKYSYAADLASMRVIVDAQGDEYWSQDLYTSWLGALRTLSPAARPEGAPSVTGSEAWGRRLLNTQLASWAELRHDTILYAKQSYSGSVACEFPDAYVEPNPAFFAAVRGHAERVVDIVDNLSFAPPASAKEHYQHFAQVAGTLEEMAEHQLTGTPHTQEHIEFINEAVVIQSICGGDSAEGWYPRLISGSSTDSDPTIADVHTQPTDEAGAPVGKVLHVATGRSRPMVVTVETCEGPRAYAGLVSSYYELVTEDFQRLNDPEWAQKLNESEPAPPDWQRGLLGR
ncbi:MAG TPA: DUF3160 domain-containing protein [Polyangiaceae bacterium]|nr:DUF3160 domain-containing protein [Polyangiaceae bacterium]